MRRLLWGGLGIGVLLLAWAVLWEPGRLRVIEHAPPVPWDGPTLRVVVLTDLHVGAPHVGLEKLEAVVAAANAADPDVVLLAGDYVIHGVWGGRFVEPEAMIPALSRLEARHGVFAVLGNHDWWYDGPRVGRALTAAGIELLENEARWIEAGLWIGGIGDLTTLHHDVGAMLATVDAPGPILAVTHHPDVFPQVPPEVRLTVAGHTHGGQVWLPLLGRLVVPSRFGQRYALGHVQEGVRHLFVGQGIGTSLLPVRFGVPPEISVLLLQQRPGTAAGEHNRPRRRVP